MGDEEARKAAGPPNISRNSLLLRPPVLLLLLESPCPLPPPRNEANCNSAAVFMAGDRLGVRDFFDVFWYVRRILTPPFVVVSLGRFVSFGGEFVVDLV